MRLDKIWLSQRGPPGIFCIRKNRVGNGYKFQELQTRLQISYPASLAHDHIVTCSKL